MNVTLNLKKFPHCEVFLISGDEGSGLLLLELLTVVPAVDELQPYLHVRGQKYASLGHSIRSETEVDNDGVGGGVVTVKNKKEYHWFDLGVYNIIRDSLRTLGVNFEEVISLSEEFPPISYYEEWVMPGCQEEAMSLGYLSIPKDYVFHRRIYSPVFWDFETHNGWRDIFPIF